MGILGEPSVKALDILMQHGVTGYLADERIEELGVLRDEIGKYRDHVGARAEGLSDQRRRGGEKD